MTIFQLPDVTLINAALEAHLPLTTLLSLPLPISLKFVAANVSTSLVRGVPVTSDTISSPLASISSVGTSSIAVAIFETEMSAAR